MRIANRGARYLCSSLAALAGLAACAHPTPEPYYREQTLELSATVAALDLPQRLISLRDDSGRMETVYAEPEIRNLEQVKVGDKVVVSYFVAVGVEVTSPDQTSQGPRQDVVVDRAGPGERPHGMVGASVTVKVQIDSVDNSFHTITFRRDDGLVRTVAIEDPQAREFIRDLKSGDWVQVTYAEAVAVAVRAAN